MTTTGIATNDNVYVLLGAGDGFTKMADGYQQYIFSFHNLSYLLPSVVPRDPPVRTIPLDNVMQGGMLGAEFPAPTLKVKEGQKLYLNLTNVGMALRPDLFDPHTVHWHGFPQAAPVFDGVPDASLSINMMANYTFFYNVVQPGTYMYHCHVEATEHMQMGMLGNLYVTPKQDNGPALRVPAGSRAGSTEVRLQRRRRFHRLRRGLPDPDRGLRPGVPRRQPDRAAAALRPDEGPLPHAQRPGLPGHRRRRAAWFLRRPTPTWKPRWRVAANPASPDGMLHHRPVMGGMMAG